MPAAGVSGCWLGEGEGGGGKTDLAEAEEVLREDGADVAA